MRHQLTGERGFDMGGFGRPYPNTGINPGAMYTGGNQRPMPRFHTGGGLPPMQNPWMTGGNQQPMSQSGYQLGGNMPPTLASLWAPQWGGLMRMAGR